MPAIEIRGLCKAFSGRPVVRDVALSATEGEVLGFLGPNGSGKTTILRMICGLLTPDAGQGTVLGRDIVRDRRRIRRQVGYMTQRFSLYEDLTLRENLDFQARAHALADRRGAVARALASLGAGVAPDQLAGTLSGGWKQRLSLEACMMHAPRILLLDEPTAGVDPGERRRFWARIQAKAAEGVTVLVSTHYMDEAERCDRLVIVSQGRVIASGTPAALAEGAGLTTFVVSGPGLDRLQAALQGRPGVAQVARFGASLHVVGSDAAALEAALQACLTPRLHGLRRVPTGIEDIFIRATAAADAAEAGR